MEGVELPPSSGLDGGVIFWQVGKVDGMPLQIVIAVIQKLQLAIGQVEVAADLGPIWIIEQARLKRWPLQVSIEGPSTWCIG
jgi:hypothetical protein